MPAKKVVAALRGPIVWDEDGPCPILYMVLIVSIGCLTVGVVCPDPVFALDAVEYCGYEVVYASLVVGVGLFVEPVGDYGADSHAAVSH